MRHRNRGKKKSSEFHPHEFIQTIHSDGFCSSVFLRVLRGKWFGEFFVAIVLFLKTSSRKVIHGQMIMV
jgi:hypothetical protein